MQDNPALQVGQAMTLKMPSGGTQTTTQVSAAYRRLEVRRGVSYGSETPARNDFTDASANLGVVAGGGSINNGPVAGVKFDEKITVGKLYAPAAQHWSPYVGIAETLGGSILSNVPATQNDAHMIAGPTAGAFYNVGNGLALYFGPTLLAAARLQGQSGGGVQPEYGAGVGARGGVFTKEDALRVEAQKLYWNQGGSPFKNAGPTQVSLEYERVLNPSVLGESGWLRSGQVLWSVGAEADVAVSDRNGCPPPYNASEGTTLTLMPYAKAAF